MSLSTVAVGGDPRNLSLRALAVSGAAEVGSLTIAGRSSEQAVAAYVPANPGGLYRLYSTVGPGADEVSYSIPINTTAAAAAVVGISSLNLERRVHIYFIRPPLSTGDLTVTISGFTDDTFTTPADLFVATMDGPTDSITFVIPAADSMPAMVDMDPVTLVAPLFTDGTYWICRVPKNAV